MAERQGWCETCRAAFSLVPGVELADVDCPRCGRPLTERPQDSADVARESKRDPDLGAGSVQ